MRGAMNATVGRDDDGKIYAISLGADHVAEHEWGIDETYRMFGINPDDIGVNPTGVKSRIVKQRPDSLMLTEHSIRKRPGGRSVGWKGVLMMMMSRRCLDSDTDIDPRELREMYDSVGRDDDQEPLSTAWSDGDFAIFARKEDEIQFLRDLDEAFSNNDVVVWLGGGGVFRNAGLCFGILSRMPKELIQSYEDTDKDKIALTKADEATGIKARLEAASEASGVKDYFRKPFRYYALSPKWAGEIKSTKDGEIKTAYDVIYWLNPCDQDNVNFGWFTVEQLDQWIKGEGPIPGGRNAKKSA